MLQYIGSFSPERQYLIRYVEALAYRDLCTVGMRRWGKMMRQSNHLAQELRERAT